VDRESHYVWGQRYLLSVIEGDAAPSVELQHSRMLLRVRPGTDAKKKQAIVEAWYRQQQWQFYRDQLNRLPVSHEDWAY